mgnify:CR=1 FL=1
MRDALIAILEYQVVTPQRAAIELGGVMGRSVSAFEARGELELLVSDGKAERVAGKEGMTHYSAPSGGGYSPGGAA